MVVHSGHRATLLCWCTCCFVMPIWSSGHDNGLYTVQGVAFFERGGVPHLATITRDGGTLKVVKMADPAVPVHEDSYRFDQDQVAGSNVNGGGMDSYGTAMDVFYHNGEPHAVALTYNRICVFSLAAATIERVGIFDDVFSSSSEEGADSANRLPNGNGGQAVTTFVQEGTNYAIIQTQTTAYVRSMQVFDLSDPTAANIVSSLAVDCTQPAGTQGNCVQVPADLLSALPAGQGTDRMFHMRATGIDVFEAGDEVRAVFALDKWNGVVEVDLTDPASPTFQSSLQDAGASDSIRMTAAQAVATFTHDGSIYAAVASDGSYPAGYGLQMLSMGAVPGVMLRRCGVHFEHAPHLASPRHNSTHLLINATLQCVCATASQQAAHRQRVRATRTTTR